MEIEKVFSVLVLLMVVTFTSGCVGEKTDTGPADTTQTSGPSVTETPTEDLEAEFPDVTTPTTAEDEVVVTDPDLEAEETVDLGSIL